MKKCLTFFAALLILLAPCIAVAGSVAYADETHTVTFMLDENTKYAEESVKNNGYASVPETPVKDGAIFVCWTRGGEKFSFKTRVTEDLVLVASWHVEQAVHTVEFKVNGETVNTQKVLHGGSVVAPAAPECPEGKYFVGWEQADLDNVTSDLVVNAIIADKEWTVTVYGLNDEVLISKKVIHGGDAELPAVESWSREGYTAKGYSGNITSITEDTDVFVEYEAEKYTVTFYVDGVKFDEQTVDYACSVRFPAVPQKENYVFSGWYSLLAGTRK